MYKYSSISTLRLILAYYDFPAFAIDTNAMSFTLQSTFPEGIAFHVSLGNTLNKSWVLNIKFKFCVLQKIKLFSKLLLNYQYFNDVEVSIKGLI